MSLKDALLFLSQIASTGSPNLGNSGDVFSKNEEILSCGIRARRDVKIVLLTIKSCPISLVGEETRRTRFSIE